MNNMRKLMDATDLTNDDKYDLDLRVLFGSNVTKDTQVDSGLYSLIVDLDLPFVIKTLGRCLSAEDTLDELDSVTHNIGAFELLTDKLGHDIHYHGPNLINNIYDIRDIINSVISSHLDWSGSENGGDMSDRDYDEHHYWIIETLKKTKSPIYIIKDSDELPETFGHLEEDFLKAMKKRQQCTVNESITPLLTSNFINDNFKGKSKKEVQDFLDKNYPGFWIEFNPRGRSYIYNTNNEMVGSTLLLKSDNKYRASFIKTNESQDLSPSDSIILDFIMKVNNTEVTSRIDKKLISSLVLVNGKKSFTQNKQDTTYHTTVDNLQFTPTKYNKNVLSDHIVAKIEFSTAFPATFIDYDDDGSEFFNTIDTTCVGMLYLTFYSEGEDNLPYWCWEGIGRVEGFDEAFEIREVFNSQDFETPAKALIDNLGPGIETCGGDVIFEYAGTN